MRRFALLLDSGALLALPLAKTRPHARKITAAVMVERRRALEAKELVCLRLPVALVRITAKKPT